MDRILTLTATLLGMFTLAGAQAMPPPTNDNCLGAIILTPTSACNPVTGDVAGATQSVPSITCNGATSDGSYDVWFGFTATQTNHTITVVGSSGFDAVVDLRTACSGASTIDCADATYDGGTEVIDATGLTVGGHYYIRVYSYGSSLPPTTTFSICVQIPGGGNAPANDDCFGAVQLNMTSACTSVNGTVAGATASVSPPSCDPNSANDDVWYRFVATASTGTVHVDGTGDFDPKIILYQGTCAGATFMRCMDDWGTNSETGVLNDLVAGQSYLLRICDAGWDIVGSPNFTICLRSAPTNDDCAQPATLSVGSACTMTAGTLDGATSSTHILGSCTSWDDVAQDVWYKFVAPGPNVDVEMTSGVTFWPHVQVFSSQCEPFQNADQCYTREQDFLPVIGHMTGLVTGDTYYVRVVYDSNVPLPGNETNFNICLHTPYPPPVNDNCTAPTQLQVSTACNYTTGTTRGATIDNSANIGCTNEGDAISDNVWYSFVVPASGDVRITVDGDGSTTTGFDAVVSLIYSTTCWWNTTQQWTCVDNTGAGGTEQIEYTAMTPGTLMRVMVYDYNTYPALTPTFRICVQDVGLSTGIADAGNSEQGWTYQLDAAARVMDVTRSTAGQGRTEWVLSDASGRSIGTGVLEPAYGHTSRIPLSGLASGPYVIAVSTGEGRSVHRFVLP